MRHRQEIRDTWLRYSNVGATGPLLAKFVVRSQHAPATLRSLLDTEQRSHGDIVEVGVPHNETRLRGPVLSMMAWFAYAADTFPSARFIAKADDDVYVQAPHFERMLRSVAAASSADAAAMMYLGVMSFFHWYPTNFEREGFGYHFMMSDQAGAASTSGLVSLEDLPAGRVVIQM